MTSVFFLEQVLNSVDREEDFLIAANSEIGQLCAQNVLLWRQLLERFASCEPVRVLLAQQHHTYRVRRFAEAFYIIDHPRHAMANCNDADVHTYLYISDSLRKSRYSLFLTSELFRLVRSSLVRGACYHYTYFYVKSALIDYLLFWDSFF